MFRSGLFLNFFILSLLQKSGCMCCLFIYIGSHYLALADLELGMCTELVLSSKSSALAGRGRRIGNLGIESLSTRQN